MVVAENHSQQITQGLEVLHEISCYYQCWAKMRQMLQFLKSGYETKTLM